MFFPIGDENISGGAYPLFSYTFLIINIVCFLYQVSLPEAEIYVFLDHYSTIPAYIQEGHHRLEKTSLRILVDSYTKVLLYFFMFPMDTTGIPVYHCCCLQDASPGRWNKA